MIDFTNCKIIPGHVYSGANGSKIAVSFEGSIHMLKFPPSAAKKPTALSYTNGCISEHLGSSIFNLIGIRAQETMLGTYTVNGKQKLVCACKDFTAGGKRLFEFTSIKNTVLDSDSNGTGTELSDILDAIDKQSYVSPASLREFFWDMFIVDALLGNFDRHNSNWGFLYDESTGNVEIAPVYDCGSCLLPQADEGTVEKVLTDDNQLRARVFQFPASCIQLDGQKINYYDFLTSAADPGCNAALSCVMPKIDMERIREFIMGVPAISDRQKEFYCRYIDARYSLILSPAYKIVTALGK